MAGKNKLQHFEEMKNFPHVFEPTMDDIKETDYHMKGKWRSDVFKNDHPIILELGCGKGEYSVGLAKKYPNKNYIGIDIKGARMWTGAKSSLEDGMQNIAFLRTRIEFITHFFEANEVDEVWLTFSDPQPRQAKERKRLSSRLFVTRYAQFLKPDGIIHMKTDNFGLFQYTMEQCKEHNYDVITSTYDLYSEYIDSLDSDTQEILSIQTHYEKLFMSKGHKIHYCKFRLPKV